MVVFELEFSQKTDSVIEYTITTAANLPAVFIDHIGLTIFSECNISNNAVKNFLFDNKLSNADNR